MHLQAGFTALGLALLVGCASQTEPRGADESTETTVSSGLSEIETQPIAEEEPASETATCAAGDTRTCKKTWSDAKGQTHCLSATQFCNAHGTGWLACGEVPGEGE